MNCLSQMKGNSCLGLREEVSLNSEYDRDCWFRDLI